MESIKQTARLILAIKHPNGLDWASHVLEKNLTITDILYIYPSYILHLAIHGDHGYLFTYVVKTWENKQMPATCETS